MPAPTIAEVVRDYVTNGVPSSGKHDPRKADWRAWGTWVEQLLAALAAGEGGFELPELIYYFTVTGGTANAVVATPNATPPTAPGAALLTMQVTADNTGAMTLNGKPLRANGGEALQAGEVKAGDLLAFLDLGSEYRLITDPASQRNKESAKEWANNAEDVAVSLAAGGDGSTTFSAKHWAAKSSEDADRSDLEADRSEVARTGSEAARDLSAGYASDIVSASNVPIFSTVDGMAALTVPIGMAAIDVRGKGSVSDGIAGHHVREVGEPEGPSKFQDSSGAWFSRVAHFVDYGYVGQPIVHPSGGRHSFSFRNTDRTAHSMYDGIFPDIHHYDGLQAVVNVEAGAGIHHVTALSGYIRSEQPALLFDTSANSVALFGLGIAAVDHAAVWGINTILQDDDARVAGTGTGRKLISELDYNVMHTGTEVIGLSVGGNCLAQPANANAFIANSLEGANTASAFKWDTAFWSPDGCARTALVVGAIAKVGANLGSQDLAFNWRDASANVNQIIMRAGADGYLVVTAPTDAAFTNLYVQSANIAIDADKSITVGSYGVVGARRGGWTAGTGDQYRGAFDADYSQTMSASYSQAEVQAMNNILVETRKRVRALEVDLTAHGLIGA